jgi:hypothetical protein
MTATLKQLFASHEKTDKHTIHSYDVVYENLFSNRKTKVKNFLEIGVSYFGGGDLAAFGEYFPKAQVHGVDINPLDTTDFPTNVHFHLGDGYNVEFLKTLPDVKWDIVLDDGPHTYESQLFVFDYFKDKLAKNGMILVEDIYPQNAAHLVNNFPGNKEFLTILDRRFTRPNNQYQNDIIFMYAPV